MNLSEHFVPEKLSGAIAAGVSDVQTSGVQRKSKGILFLIQMGTITATAVTNIEVEGADQDSGYAPVKDTSGVVAELLVPDSGSDLIVVVDCPEPQEQFLRLNIDRGTANAAIDSISVLHYKLRKKPALDAANLPAEVAAAATFHGVKNA